jgi:hypothetical protein
MLVPLGGQNIHPATRAQGRLHRRTRCGVVQVGATAAAGNAVCHATGARFRRLPIRIEDMLASV